MVSKLSLITLAALVTLATSCAFEGCDGCKKMVDDVKVRFNNNFSNVDDEELRQALETECKLLEKPDEQNPKKCVYSCGRYVYNLPVRMLAPLKAGEDSVKVCMAAEQCQ